MIVAEERKVDRNVWAEDDGFDKGFVVERRMEYVI